jgi:hypothetical protein
MLAMPRIHGFFKSSTEKKNVKVWMRSKQEKQDPLIFDILSLISMVLYVAFLFNANQFYTKCNSLV